MKTEREKERKRKILSERKSERLSFGATAVSDEEGSVYNRSGKGRTGGGRASFLSSLWFRLSLDTLSRMGTDQRHVFRTPRAAAVGLSPDAFRPGELRIQSSQSSPLWFFTAVQRSWLPQSAVIYHRFGCESCRGPRLSVPALFWQTLGRKDVAVPGWDVYEWQSRIIEKGSFVFAIGSIGLWVE